VICHPVSQKFLWIVLHNWTSWCCGKSF